MITIKNDAQSKNIKTFDEMEIGETGIIEHDDLDYLAYYNNMLVIKTYGNFVVSLSDPRSTWSTVNDGPRDLKVRLVDIEIIVKEREWTRNRFDR